jgi:hypothetical protein
MTASSAAFGFLMSPEARAAVSLVDSDWKVKLGGIVEFDTIMDSTRGLAEAAGNGPIARRGTANGDNGRTQFSIRNSRLGFSVEAPRLEGGWDTRAYVEFDALGYDPGPAPAPQQTSETTAVGSTTFRTRHYFLQAANDDWDVLAGQTWEFFGWQPYYFLNTIQVSPLPATLFNRTPQLRVVRKGTCDRLGYQAALAISRPPQRDSQYPGLEGGVRVTMDSRKSGFNGGSGGAWGLQPMSLAVSGTFREFKYQNPGSNVDSTARISGAALAVDSLIPIIASPDGKSVGHTLTFVGEFTTGSGYGDQFGGWTGGIRAPLNGTGATGAAANTNLDAGLGDYFTDGAFHLIHLMTWNAQLQYNFADSSRTWMTLGHSSLFSNNISSAVDVTDPYQRTESNFINVYHDFTKQVRVGLEYALLRTQYTDATWANDNRYQASVWFLF